MSISTKSIESEPEHAERQAAHIAELEAEVARLKAGGCARDQHTTQFCAEAVEANARAEARIAEMEAEIAGYQENDYHKTRDINLLVAENRVQTAQLMAAGIQPDTEQVRAELTELNAMVAELATLRAQVGALKTENTVLFAQVEQLQDGTYVLEIERDNATLRAQAEASRILLTVAGMGADGKPGTLTEMVQEAIIQIDALQSQAERDVAVLQAAEMLAEPVAADDAANHVSSRLHTLVAAVRARRDAGEGEAK